MEESYIVLCMFTNRNSEFFGGKEFPSTSNMKSMNGMFAYYYGILWPCITLEKNFKIDPFPHEFVLLSGSSEVIPVQI